MVGGMLCKSDKPSIIIIIIIATTTNYFLLGGGTPMDGLGMGVQMQMVALGRIGPYGLLVRYQP